MAYFSSMRDFYPFFIISYISKLKKKNVACHLDSEFKCTVFTVFPMRADIPIFILGKLAHSYLPETILEMLAELKI